MHKNAGENFILYCQCKFEEDEKVDQDVILDTFIEAGHVLNES
jgi:hypothetical protein